MKINHKKVYPAVLLKQSTPIHGIHQVANATQPKMWGVVDS